MFCNPPDSAHFHYLHFLAVGGGGMCLSFPHCAWCALSSFCILLSSEAKQQPESKAQSLIKSNVLSSGCTPTVCHPPSPPASACHGVFDWFLLVRFETSSTEKPLVHGLPVKRTDHVLHVPACAECCQVHRICWSVPGNGRRG